MNKKERNREREREREQKQKWDSETAVVYVKIEWISGSSAFTSAYDTNFKFRLQPELLTHQCKSGGGSHDPSFRLHNLLERLTQLKKTVYSPDWWFIIKDTTQVQAAKWNRERDRAECVKLPPLCPGRQPPSTTYSREPLTKHHPQASSRAVFLRKHVKQGWLHHWPQVLRSTFRLTALPGGQGAGLKVPIPKEKVGSRGNLPAYFRAFQNYHLININSAVV